MAAAVIEKRCLSIQSHVVHGYVGNKSAVFPLQLLGFDVCACNSVQLSAHTGYKVIKGQVLSGDQLSALVDGLQDNGLMAFTHVLTGYMSAASCAHTVARVVALVRSHVPDAVFVCDPVLGDHGKLYVPAELIPIYRDELVPLATILTPNQFEAETLTGVRVHDAPSAFAACDALHAAGARMVVVTSTDIPSGSAAGDDMLLCGSCPWECVRDDWDGVFSGVDRGASPTARFTIAIPKLPSVFTGSGDLTAALLLANYTQHPASLVTACEKTIATVQAVCKRTMTHYRSCMEALEAARADAASGASGGHSSWLLDMASSSSGQMGSVIPAFNELRVVQSKADIEHPVVPDSLRAKAVVL